MGLAVLMMLPILVIGFRQPFIHSNLQSQIYQCSRRQFLEWNEPIKDLFMEMKDGEIERGQTGSREVNAVHEFA